ncbi:MAG: hypothetical protein LC800_06060 [Acidobacteria bacterium]|nr:hypothetical protein [Acidobacteriota bacterium]
MSTTHTARPDKLRLLYMIFCDDVRLEVGNKLSLMGLFQNIAVQQMPVALFKFAVISHWEGEGSYLSEVRVLSPDRSQVLAAQQPTRFELEPGGTADNISFFFNVQLPAPGQYWVQTLIDSTLFDERPLAVIDINAAGRPDDTSESVN